MSISSTKNLTRTAERPNISRVSNFCSSVPKLIHNKEEQEMKRRKRMKRKAVNRRGRGEGEEGEKERKSRR